MNEEKLCDVDECTGHDEALNINKYNAKEQKENQAACSCGCIKGQLIQSLEAQKK